MLKVYSKLYIKIRRRYLLINMNSDWLGGNMINQNQQQLETTTNPGFEITKKSCTIFLGSNEFREYFFVVFFLKLVDRKS